MRLYLVRNYKALQQVLWDIDIETRVYAPASEVS
jgi:hypothetical protein